MTVPPSAKTPLCNDELRPFERQADAEGFYLHCTGGFRAVRIDPDRWIVGPILEGARPVLKGYFSPIELRKFLRENRIIELAFQQSTIRNGRYYSLFTPLIPQLRNHLEGPSQLWGNISGNLGRDRFERHLSEHPSSGRAEIAAVLDDQESDERLSRFISHSLRGMDINIEQIAELYHDKLVDHMSVGSINGERTSSTLETLLFSYIHSFFLHAGAVRDYLASFVALKIGENPEKVDSLARLLGKLKNHDIPSNPLLELLRTSGVISPSADLGEWESAGWMRTLTELRNTFTHRRPYGSKFEERSGHIETLHSEWGLYRYVHPVHDAVIGGEKDIFDVIVSQYKSLISLSYNMAVLSRMDTSPMTFTDKDIIEVERIG